MAKVVAGMTTSLDGFVEDGAGSVAKLYPDFKAMRESAVLQESMVNTGAVLMGRRTFEMAGDTDGYADNYEYQVPIFVLTHQAPERHPRENEHLKFTFVGDGIESAVWQAKAAAGEKDVTVVGGASTIQELLRAGLVDEVHVDIMPVLLGGGLRLFEQIGKAITLEKIDVSETGTRTSLRFRVVSSKIEERV